MASEITKITAQFFHQSDEPLDKSQQVNNVSELYDLEKVIPYVGKLVHVKDLHTIYVCSSAASPATAVWRPVMADDGTAFFITSKNGEVYAIGAEVYQGTGRITVTIPSPTIAVVNPPN